MDLFKITGKFQFHGPLTWDQNLVLLFQCSPDSDEQDGRREGVEQVGEVAECVAVIAGEEGQKII